VISTAPGPSTTPEHALDWLRRAIAASELRPGQRVAQEEVADALGVSVAPVREALRVLEQEGQVRYFPRRGYFVTELRIADLEEIYDLRRLLEARAARHALPGIDPQRMAAIEAAARECELAAERGDVAAELRANRRFHLAILEAGDRPHTLRVIALLWDSTEAYRAMYYNSPAERLRSVQAHARIIAAIRRRDADAVVAELDSHRDRGLEVLRGILAEAA
jgi:DNA-binding GntR family transcriptional regulator